MQRVDDVTRQFAAGFDARRGCRDARRERARIGEAIDRYSLVHWAALGFACGTMVCSRGGKSGLSVLVYRFWFIGSGLSVLVYRFWSIGSGLSVLVYRFWSIGS
ncbi:MAG TPA: hypothetical protein VF835_00105, partial [Rhizomicrobium sp.]